jgi:ElaB/YqjD/DUF883 family membrane-anchored ribosome-binding protein
MAGTTNPTRNPNESQTASQQVAGMTERAKDMAAALGDKAKDATSSAVHKAEGAAEYVGHKAEGAADYVGHKAEDATTAVGGGLRNLGNNLRHNAPQTGILGDASSAVANTLERTGSYIQDEGLRGIADDVTNLIRRNPIPALFVGVGVGFLLARALTPRS